MIKKAGLIYNPVSGHEQMPKNVADILNTVEQTGYEASAFHTTPEAFSTQHETTRVAKAGFDLTIAAGGDGTINEVVNGVAGLSQRPKLTIIPAGTTDDFVWTLKIPRDSLVETVEAILQDKTRRMGVDQAICDDNEKYFVNIVGSGLLTELTYGAPSELKSAMGYGTYLTKGAEMLPSISKSHMKLTYDDGVYDGDLSMFLFGMTSSVGGFEQIVPDAELSDGSFQLIVIKTADPLMLLLLIVMALNGRHVNDPNIIYTKTRSLKVKTADDDGSKVPLSLDGEIGGYLSVTLKNLQQYTEPHIGR